MRSSRITLAVIVGLMLAAGVIFPSSPMAATTQAKPSSTGLEEVAKLTASDGADPGTAQFGNHVAVSGGTAVVGAPNMHTAYNGVGAAYVFTRAGTAWVEQTKLTPSDGLPGDRFGWSVAISGNTIVVSSIWDDVGTNVDQGSAYVFTRTAGTWTEQAKLTAAHGVSASQFGFSVAVEGDLAFIGAAHSLLADADQEQVGLAPQGKAYVFARTGGTWTQQQELIASDRSFNDHFGTRIAFDGDTAVVGASGGKGSAYVFTRVGDTWLEQQRLVATSGADGDEFGFWVGVSRETVVVGALSASVTYAKQGAAYVFTRSAGIWTQQKRLVASDAAANDAFGRSVAVSGDTIVAGAMWDDAGTNVDENKGSAYVFNRTGGTWNQTEKLTAHDAADGDLFGVSVAISGDTAVVGASFAKVLGKSPIPAQGAAYVFDTCFRRHCRPRWGPRASTVGRSTF
ncbi:MAG: hypothetical protein QOC92_3311 [Acidimicrobiaceae bacterium]